MFLGMSYLTSCVLCSVFCFEFRLCVVLGCVVFFRASCVACRAFCGRVLCRFVPYAVLLRCFVKCCAYVALCFVFCGTLRRASSVC